MLDIAQKQRNLALKAKAKPHQRIGDIFPLICQKGWMMQAMWNVLHNRGAETAGIDGKIKAMYYDAEMRSLTANAIEQIEEICQSLEMGSYQPQPARRIYIPKANGKMRPISISTLDDRMVQEAIRMAIEPIYESDFLNCSYGFRPNRCTMDAVTVCRRYIQSRIKCYWVIEGDIKACFDSADSKILMRLLRQRIADRKLTDTIYKLLKAGYRENGTAYKPKVGIPQGGVCSPLLMNVYLHEFDKWWTDRYDLDRKAKAARRKAHLGNFFLVRYSDDFIVLSNGTKRATEEVKEEIAGFMREELRLELSQEKTAIAHVFDGFDFLGFHIRKYRRSRDPKGIVITPTKANTQRIRDEIVKRLSRQKHDYAVASMIQSLNPVIRGWANYYRYVNSKRVFSNLTFYLHKKFLKWYRGKYRLPERKGTREGKKWLKRDEPFHLYGFAETEIKRYSWRRKPNPYIKMNVKRMTTNPFPESRWYGNADRDADLRFLCLQRDQGMCQICGGCKTNLHAHHIIPLSEGGEDSLDNLITVCEDCHRKHSWQEIMRLVGSRMRCKVASPVST